MGALPRVRPRVPDARRHHGHLQGPPQSRRDPDGALGLRRRRPVRSDREEAVLSRRAGIARVLLRHARLRPQVRVLSELGHVAGAARSRRGHDDHRDEPGAPRARRHPLGRALRRQHLQRAPHHDRVGRRRVQGRPRGRAAHRVRVERPRHTGGARLPRAVDRHVQSRSEGIRRAAVPGTTAGDSNPCWTRSGGCTPVASGSKW